MTRLTTREKYPHGAEGVSERKLTGNWCRGKFEATAVVEKLAKYENLEEDGKLFVCDQIIFPKTVSRLFGLNMEMALKILEDLSEKGFLRREFTFWCSHCKTIVGPSYQVISSIPDVQKCDQCGTVMNPLEDVIITYRKRVNEK